MTTQLQGILLSYGLNQACNGPEDMNALRKLLRVDSENFKDVKVVVKDKSDGEENNMV